VLILALAWWVDSVRPARIWLATSGAIGVATYVWLVVEGSLGHITWIVDFFETTNPVYRAWRAVMPDYMNMNAWAWTWHGAWIAACAGLAAWGWASARRSAPTGVMSQDRNIEPLVPAQ
jgi:hypothetical protein